jgi:prevent-host-death family protein
MYSFTMAIPVASYVVSVSEATALGVAGLVRAAEQGEDVFVSRRGRPVAVMVSVDRLDRLRDLESDLRDVALVMARSASDTGSRIGLDEAIAALGFSRKELEADLDADLAAGRA